MLLGTSPASSERNNTAIQVREVEECTRKADGSHVIRDTDLYVQKPIIQTQKRWYAPISYDKKKCQDTRRESAISMETRSGGKGVRKLFK